MHDSSRNSHPQTSSGKRECVCGSCTSTAITVPGTKCGCGGLMRASSGSDFTRKAFGMEDTDLKKGGLR